jgi:hypothetical protein
MPFQPPQSGGNGLEGLDLLLKLRGLQEAQRLREREVQQDALRTALSVVGAGGDPSALLGQLDPNTATALTSAYEGRRQDMTRAALADSLSPAAITPYSQAIAPIADASGNIVPPTPEMEHRATSALTAQLDALGVPRALHNVAIERARVGAMGMGRGAQEQVAGERRQAATTRANASHSAGLQEAAARRAEQRAIRAEQRAKAARDADEFTVNAATIAFADPSRQPDLVAEAAQRFGPEAARDFEYRIANMTEAGLAKMKLSQQDREAKVAQALEEGRTSDTRVASLAADGKAGYDPTTGFYYAGQDPVTEKRLSGLSSLYEIHRQYEKAAEQFAKSVGGDVLTGTIEEIKKKGGYEGNPEFTALTVLGTRYRERLKYLESGAAVNPDEYARAQALAPDTAQLNIKNGQLMPAARVGFSAAREDLESMYLSAFSRADKGGVRSALRTFGDERLNELESDPTSWLRQIGQPTTRGASLLQSIREAVAGGGAPVAPQPGAR